MNFNESVRAAVRAHNNFKGSPQRIGTTDFGKLLPIFCEDVLPTDKFSIDQDVFIRLAPMVVPTFGRIRAYINYFYVEERNIVEDWDLMTSGGSTGTYPEDFPFINAAFLGNLFDDWDDGKPKLIYNLANAFGIPLSRQLVADYAPSAETLEFRLDPWLVYNQIFACYYAPIDLMDDDYFEKSYMLPLRGTFGSFDQLQGYYADKSQSTFDLPHDFFHMKFASYKKDVFNTAYTRPQRGAQSLVPVKSDSQFPFGLVGKIFSQSAYDGSSQGNLFGLTSTGGNNYRWASMDNIQASSASWFGTDVTFKDKDVSADSDHITLANLSTYTFRFADALQRVLERNNIAGARYLEQMLARFGVKLTAERLARPQYIGGTEFTIQIGDITSTANTEVDGTKSYLGQQAGKGIGSGHISVNFDVPDHGWIMGILHLVPDTEGSVQGLPKKFTRKFREDYFMPEYEDCGLVPIYNRELLLDQEQAASKPLDGVFGYQSPYYEYKMFSDAVFGDMAQMTTGNETEFLPDILTPWMLFRKYDETSDTLNETFPMMGNDGGQFNRIFQESNSDFDHFYCWIQTNVNANRPMLGFADAALSFANEIGSGRINVPYGGLRL